MFKKLLCSLLVCFLVLPIFAKASFIYAEDDEEVEEVEDYEDEEEEVVEKSDREKCIQDNDREACRAVKESVSGEVSELDKKIKEAEADAAKAEALMEEFALKASDSQREIEELKVQIDELVARIAELEKEIEKNEAKVEELNGRVKDRMVAYQKTMHFNGYLEFILGSKSFTDMLRRIYGVQSVTSKDKNDREEFIEVITKLNSDKKELDEDKKALDESYDDLIVKQAEYIQMKEFYSSEIERIEAELEAMTEEKSRIEYFDDDPILKEALRNVGVLNNGFVAAVHGSWISEGVWHYSDDFLGGTWHTGVDYAASQGTEIHAPAGGVIIRADDSCSGYNDSYACGEWISGGGNQVYLLAEVDGVVYGFMFFHMSSVYVGKGDIVDQDEVIGTVGDTGHSYGAHCHIEMYKLGRGTLAEISSYGWNSTFGLGRHEQLYENRCSVTSAPCICDPRDYLPG